MGICKTYISKYPKQYRPKRVNIRQIGLCYNCAYYSASKPHSNRIKLHTDQKQILKKMFYIFVMQMVQYTVSNFNQHLRQQHTKLHGKKAVFW